MARSALPDAAEMGRGARRCEGGGMLRGVLSRGRQNLQFKIDLLDLFIYQDDG
jgi:ribosomal protein S14